MLESGGSIEIDSRWLIDGLYPMGVVAGVAGQ